MKNSISKEFEVQIGHIFYNFVIEFWYYPGTHSIDPTEGEEPELVTWDFEGPIQAWDQKNDVSSVVESDYDVQIIKDHIDIYDLFDQAIS
jgi:hypothetical protein